MGKLAIGGFSLRHLLLTIAVAVIIALVMLTVPVEVWSADTPQVPVITIPINLAFPLVPAMTVIPNGPPTNGEIIVGALPLSNGLIGIVRLNGSF